MKTIRYAFVRSLPIMAGYIVLGLGFGVLLQSKGYGAGWALVMSGLIYAGSMQYVAIDLLAGGASLISAAIMTLMVNARHLFYGISMLERYKDTGAAKPYLIFALTDETYSVVCSGGVPEGVDRKKYYFWVSLLNQLYWIAGGVAGTLSREEIETEIDAELFAKLEHLIGKPLIRKERRGYRLPGGLTLEVNCVDPDLPTVFWYAEVEFETEAQALAWDPAAAGLADYLHDECTGKPGSSMGEYWLQTRK